LTHLQNLVDEGEAKFIPFCILYNSVNDSIVVCIVPLITKLHGMLRVHFNESSNVLQDQLLELVVLEICGLVVSLHDICLNVLEPSEDVWLYYFNLEEHLETLLVVVEDLVKINSDHVHWALVCILAELFDHVFVYVIFD